MKRWQFWVGVLISIVFLWWALNRLNLPDFWRAIQTANYWWILPGVAVYFVAVWARAWRWHYLLKADQSDQDHASCSRSPASATWATISTRPGPERCCEQWCSGAVKACRSLLPWQPSLSRRILRWGGHAGLCLRQFAGTCQTEEAARGSSAISNRSAIFGTILAFIML